MYNVLSTNTLLMTLDVKDIDTQENFVVERRLDYMSVSIVLNICLGRHPLVHV